MPRNGSGVYSADWVNATPNVTIESAKQNAMIADLVADANAARPITAGGTGETTARLKDGTWRFQNTADTSKLLAFDLSGLTTGTTRTLSVPDGSGSIMLTATAVSNAQALAGSVVNSAHGAYTNNGDLTAVIPFDDTTPRWDEGTLILTAGVTPKSTTNKIRARFVCEATADAVAAVVAAMYINPADVSTAAVRTTYTTVPSAGYAVSLALEYEYTPGSTALQEVSMRVGPNTGTMRLNGNTVSRLFGGTMAATLTVEEIKA